MVDVWSRAGAIAGRGFHYQDAVGAWLCALLLDGRVRAGRLVPEGFEDLHLEGEDHVFVQVKSRQEKRGAFSVNETLGFLVEMWDKHLARVQAGIDPGKLMLVQERAVAGETFSAIDSVLGELPDSHELVSGLRERLDPEDADSLLSRTTLLTLEWQVAQVEAVDAIVATTGAVRAAAEVAERQLRVDIADAADRNANARDAASAASIDRSFARHRIDEIVGLLDRDALQRALAEGICVPVQFAADVTAEDYYLGTSARPAHISAGLPAPMPEVVGQAIEHLGEGKPVLLTGPSGVGKSTALWSAVYTRRDVVWYQVKRTSPDAIRAIVDLLRAMGSSARNQVGLVVDGVGSGEVVDWDGLREATAQIDGTMLLGSVRHEDLVGVQNRADCAIIEVALTEEIASSLFENLRELGLTAVAHWREALSESHGLTMEFTYLLTRGQRLQDVIRDQVRIRIRERREAELQVLALAATASRWGLPVPISALSVVVDDPGTLRQALARLVAEHLVQIAGDAVDGLHPLRSRFISESVHEAPPPSASATISSLVALIPEAGLPALFAGVAKDIAAALPSAIEALIQRIRRGGTPDLIAGLRAMRFVDLERRSERWIEVLDRHAVALPKRLFAIQLAMLDSDLTNLPFPENVTDAVNELRDISREPFDELTNLIRSVGVDGAAAAVFEMQSPRDITELLGAAQGIAADLLLELVVAIQRMAESGRRVCAFASEPNLDDLAELLLAAQSLDAGVAEQLMQSAGGVDPMIRRLQDRFPWAVEVAVRDVAEDQVLSCRLLHVSDELQGSADANAREIARLGIACIPVCASADIATVSADGLPYEIGQFRMGVSKLQRRYLHSQSAVNLNRQTANFAAARIYGATLTERVSIGFSGLTLADVLLKRLVLTWLRGENRPRELETLHELRVELEALASQLVPVADSPLSSGRVPIADSLHTLLTGIAIDLPDRLARPDNYRALAMYLSETLVDAARACENEAWEMIERHPLELIDRIATQLEALATVIEEVALNGTAPRDLRQAARSGESEGALTRAAELATRNATRRGNRGQERRFRALREMGLSARSYERSTARVYNGWPPQQFAIGIEVANVVEWLTNADALAATLTPAAEEAAYRPALVVFAVINGRRVDGYGLQIIRSALPQVEPLHDWGVDLPAAWDTTRSDAFKLAQHALIVLSALGVLSRYRSVASLEQVRRTAESQFDAGRGLLSEYDDDITGGIVAYLDSAAAGVSDEPERSAELDQTQTYAAQLMGLVRGLETPAGRESLMYGNLAIQADIDLDTARSLIG